MYNKKTCFSNFTKKGRIFLFFSLAAVPISPQYFLAYPRKKGNSWQMAYSDLLQRDSEKTLLLCGFLLESIIPTALLIIFSLIAKAKFNERIKKSQENGLASNPSQLRKSEIQFSRMTVITMTLFIMTRLIDLIVGFVVRFLLFEGSIHCRLDAIVYLLRQLAFLLLLSWHAFKPLIFYAMDSKLKEVLPKRYVQRFKS